MKRTERTEIMRHVRIDKDQRCSKHFQFNTAKTITGNLLITTWNTKLEIAYSLDLKCVRISFDFPISYFKQLNSSSDRSTHFAYIFRLEMYNYQSFCSDFMKSREEVFQQVELSHVRMHTFLVLEIQHKCLREADEVGNSSNM